MRVWASSTFSAAHSLPKVAPGHKCARLHGHTYRVTLTAIGPLDEDSGMVVDFAILKGFVIASGGRRARF